MNWLYRNRPKEIDADVLRFQDDYEKWVVIIGKVYEKPYEIYIGLLENFPIPENVNRGKVLKEKTEPEILKCYFKFKPNKFNGAKTESLLITDTFGKIRNLSILISGLIQCEMPFEEIIKTIKSLEFDFDPKNLWKKEFVRTLEDYFDRF
jgi:ribonucleoside-diphosphate reductase alpha chain